MTLQKSISCSQGPGSVVGEKGEKEKSRERKNSGERAVIFALSSTAEPGPRLKFLKLWDWLECPERPR